MKYSVQYQYMPKGASHPSDDGQVIGTEASDENGLVILSNVEDFVQIRNSGGRSSFFSKVRSRTFLYIWVPDDSILCHANIVVAETDDDWARIPRMDRRWADFQS